MDGTSGRPRGQTNVLGEPIASCSHDPITGFFRDGCCNTGPSDIGNAYCLCGDDGRFFGLQQVGR